MGTVAASPPALNMGDLMGDVGQLAAMADHFDKIQKLKDPVAGCPNFRRVPGYKVYCCGQPTVAGFEAALNKVCGETYPKTGKIIWINMRQEPDVYINGEPVCARPANKIGEYAELGNVTRDSAKATEVKFPEECEKRIAGNGGKLKVVDINKKESEKEVKEILSLSKVIENMKEKFPGLVHMRVPVCNSAAPLETDSGMNLNLLKMDTYKMDMAKDTLFRGEFPVVVKLVEQLADGSAAKNVCDKVIDKNGTPKTGG